MLFKDEFVFKIKSGSVVLASSIVDMETKYSLSTLALSTSETERL